MPSRRSFLAGVAALAAAPEVLTFPTGVRALYDPTGVLVTIGGVPVRGPVDGSHYVWIPEAPRARPEHTQRLGQPFGFGPTEPGYDEPDPATPWNPYWKRRAARLLG